MKIRYSEMYWLEILYSFLIAYSLHNITSDLGVKEGEGQPEELC